MGSRFLMFRINICTSWFKIHSLKLCNCWALFNFGQKFLFWGYFWLKRAFIILLRARKGCFYSSYLVLTFWSQFYMDNAIVDIKVVVKFEPKSSSLDTFYKRYLLFALDQQHTFWLYLLILSSLIYIILLDAK